MASLSSASFPVRLRKKVISLFSFIWPVNRSECWKVLPLLLLKFLVSFNYGIMASLKNALVVHASKKSGAESTLLIKVLVLFVSIAFAMLYMKLSNYFSFGTLFYALISIFVLLFILYARVLFPQEQTLKLDTLANKLEAFLASCGFTKGALFSEPLRNWVPSTFFMLSDLWGQIGIFLLYWGLANRICSMSEAKRHYNIFIVGGTFSQLLSTYFSDFFREKYKYIGLTKKEAHLRTTTGLLYLMTASALCMMLVYAWIAKKVLPHVDRYKKRVKKDRLHLSLRKSLRHIAQSSYLISIAITVTACAFCLNLVEVTYKSNCKIQYQDRDSYHAFNTKVSRWQSFSSTMVNLLIGGQVLRGLGFRYAAYLTPIITGATGLLFFGMSYMKQHPAMVRIADTFGLNALQMVVYMGAVESVLSKVAKYSFFDTTKEVVYIPLNEEEKRKSKAALDVIGSRLGKGLSSLVHWLLISFFSVSRSVLDVTYLLMPILLIVIVFWLYAARYLSNELDDYEKKPTHNKHIL